MAHDDATTKYRRLSKQNKSVSAFTRENIAQKETQAVNEVSLLSADCYQAVLSNRAEPPGYPRAP
jgi:hypothetical protein